MNGISPRTAQLALTGIGVALRLAAPQRNGTPLPLDIRTALAELWASANGRELGPTDLPVQRFEQISTGEAARRLGISDRAVRNRCAAGTLPARRVGQRAWLIDWEQEWQASSSTTPGTSGPTYPTASTTG